ASPLVTLLVMYAGLRLFGIPGLILGPIALSAVMAAVEE
ncbi:MAG: AI-2E family transporter, partial [Oscillospiraceae bacterium]|nr:AI-2E family transporter [Oscillospiraceae bacterium]